MHAAFTLIPLMILIGVIAALAAIRDHERHRAGHCDLCDGSVAPDMPVCDDCFDRKQW